MPNIDNTSKVTSAPGSNRDDTRTPSTLFDTSATCLKVAGLLTLYDFQHPDCSPSVPATAILLSGMAVISDSKLSAIAKQFADTVLPPSVGIGENSLKTLSDRGSQAVRGAICTLFKNMREEGMITLAEYSELYMRIDSACVADGMEAPGSHF